MNQSRSFVTGRGRDLSRTPSALSSNSETPGSMSSPSEGKTNAWVNSAYVSNFPALGQSQGLPSHKCSALALRSSQTTYIINFPRQHWNIMTFPNQSEAILANVASYAKDLDGKNSFAVSDTLKIALVLSPTEKRLFRNDTLSHLADVHMYVLDPAEAEGKNLSDSETVYVYVTPPNLTDVKPTTVVLTECAANAKSANDLRQYIVTQLRKMPSLPFGCTTYAPGFLSDGVCKEHPNLFTSEELGAKIKVLTKLLIRCATSMSQDGSNAFCPKHPKVKIVHESNATSYVLFNRPNGMVATNLILSDLPDDDCPTCWILKLAISEARFYALDGHHRCRSGIITSSVFRYLASIVIRVRMDSVLAPSDASSTDHAALVNMMCGIIQNTPAMRQLGISTGSEKVNNRSMRVIIMQENADRLTQMAALYHLFLDYFGALNGWGFYFCSLTSLYGEFHGFSVGFSGEITHVNVASVIAKNWDTQSGIDNILEFKTITIPVHNEDIVCMVERTLAESFEVVMNEHFNGASTIKVRRNGGDSRFNFTISNPRDAFLLLQKAVADGGILQKILCRAMLKAITSHALRADREVQDVSFSFVLKMRLNPVNKSDSKSSELAHTAQMNSLPVFLASTPFTMQLGTLRDALLKKTENVTVINMARTTEEVSKDALQEILKSIGGSSMTLEDTAEPVSDAESIPDPPPRSWASEDEAVNSPQIYSSRRKARKARAASKLSK
uniref:Non-structural protein 4 n=1 Tax=Rice dwarf virus (isolate Akita) TaxID=142803 RepID=NSP4_RDVA|nr:RecName: Full=Non-structural protein 4; Short=Pns4 [Rice dwarf virus (isolate Akita)]CAA38442.1 unnamed protein product [Rice dwarf virus]